jgi:hypothetical protein
MAALAEKLNDRPRALGYEALPPDHTNVEAAQALTLPRLRATNA